MLTNQNIFIIKLFHRSLTIAISLSCTCFAAKCDRTFSKSQQYSQYYEATSYNIYIGIVVILGIGTKKQDLFTRKNCASSVYQYIILKLHRKTEHELRL